MAFMAEPVVGATPVPCRCAGLFSNGYGNLRRLWRSSHSCEVDVPEWAGRAPLFASEADV